MSWRNTSITPTLSRGGPPTKDHHGSSDVAEVQVVVDCSSFEAVAVAFTLQHVVDPHLVSTPEKLPRILEDNESATEDIQDLLIICTNGIFQQRSTLLSLAAAGEARASPLPILADANFQIPTAATLTSLHDLFLELGQFVGL